MPRQTTDQKITTRTQRAKLSPRGRPYYRRLSDTLAIGYRRLNTLPGTWIVRRRLDNGSYTETKLQGVSPDDVTDSDGRSILNFDQAATFARRSHAKATQEITLEDAADKWASSKAAETDNKTRQNNYAYTAARIVRGFPKNRTINELTADEITSWRNAHLQNDASHDEQRRRRATANRELATLKAICNRAANGLKMEIARPWEKVGKFPKADSFGKRVIVLDKAQRIALLAAAESIALGNLIRAAMETGCRYGELCSATVGDLDAHRRRLAVHGKTGARTIILSPATAAFLSKIIYGVKDPHRTILVKENGMPWSDGDQIAPFAQAVKKAGLEPETTLYATRHSYITDHLAAGVPIAAVAKQCGTSVSMIEATYANFVNVDLDRWFSMETT